jgi:hypothetical protein
MRIIALMEEDGRGGDTDRMRTIKVTLLVLVCEMVLSFVCAGEKVKWWYKLD